jgi:hypothetical protein
MFRLDGDCTKCSVCHEAIVEDYLWLHVQDCSCPLQIWVCGHFEGLRDGLKDNNTCERRKFETVQQAVSGKAKFFNASTRAVESDARPVKSGPFITYTSQFARLVPFTAALYTKLTIKIHLTSSFRKKGDVVPERKKQNTIIRHSYKNLSQVSNFKIITT